MSLKPFNAVAALVALLLSDIAPAVMRQIRTDPRACDNPGFAVSIARLETWLSTLARRRAAALTAARLAEALRAAFIIAASRGRIVIDRRDRDGGQLEVEASDLALVEIVRELAAALDHRRGGAVAAAFDAWRDETLDRAFALGRAAAHGERGDG
ncbi:hypothetical protein [Rubrimonas cliftonensis]|uniref:Uncharacterized protein n=1 Tax=Rubrimonas cliftonensis TaxID=89524 RepID=A0A1H4FGB9_9RHOB|nr:hypothetical protein [Rubrimonas cliftonensis]SEA96399.1 hypothetical protein SAMN05444370_12217 [Rubrimonas cliftonensis]